MAPLNEENKENDFESNSDAIKVYIRVRPPAANLGGNPSCINIVSDNSLMINAKPQPRPFTFDFVAGEETTQEQVFQKVGKPIAESCIQGYNGTIFAYGQTGSGKTYTMLGPNEQDYDLDQGLIPRTITYLYELAYNKGHLTVGSNFQFLCKCSFIEIYNEHVYDLLDPAKTNPLNVRESITRGVFVDHLIETVAATPKEAFKILSKGWHNRRVAGTAMNRESSRSHAVFVMTVETKEKDGELLKVRNSVLNLVDLAGSERQRDTNTTGLRLREAGNINKSLSVFGNVIMCLVDCSKGKARHIPYRDSKLTFLLRDSLGGNSKTFIIANVHPSTSCFGETLSTLQFAQRAKQIVNQANVNETSEGDLITLQKENRRLKMLLQDQKNSPSIDLVKNENFLHNDYEDYFFQSMMLWRVDATEITELTKNLKNIESVCEKKDKMVKSLRMIIKFRDHRIKDLQGKQESDFSEERRRFEEEISLLNEQILNHPEVAELRNTVENLKRTLHRLNSMKSVEDFAQFTNNKKEDLLTEFKKIKTERDVLKEENETAVAETAASNERLVDLETENRELRDQLAMQEPINNQQMASLKSRIVELESELTGKKVECVELDKLLTAARDSAKMQVDNLLSLHNCTIRSLTTTPLRRTKKDDSFLLASTPASKRIRLMNDSNQLNSASPALSSPALGMVDISLDSGGDASFAATDDSAAAAAAAAVRAENEAQLTALQQEMDAMRKEQAEMLEKFHTKEHEFNDLLQTNASLQQKSDSNKQLLDAFESERESLTKSLREKQKKLEDMNRELEMRVLEVRDYKILLKSADKELAEKKAELKVKIEEYKKEKEFRVELNKIRPEYEAKCGEVTRLKAEHMQAQSELETNEAEIKMFQHNLQQSQDEVSSLKKNCLDLNGQIESLREELVSVRLHAQGSDKAMEDLCEANRELKTYLTQESEKNVGLETELTRIRSESSAQQRDISEKDTIISDLMMKNNERERICQDYLCDITRISKDQEESKNKIQVIIEENEKLLKEKEESNKNLSVLQQSSVIEISKLNFKVDNLEDDLTNFSDEYEVMRKKAETFQQLTEQQQQQISDINVRMEGMKEKHESETDELKSRFQREREEYLSLQGSWEEASNELKQRDTRLDMLQTQLETAVSDYQTARKRNQEFEAKLESRNAEMSELKSNHFQEMQLIHSERLDAEASHEESMRNERLKLQSEIDKLKSQIDAHVQQSLLVEEKTNCLEAKLRERKEETIDVNLLKQSNEECIEKISDLREECKIIREERQHIAKSLTYYKEENQKLNTKLSEVLGHQNPQQKIQYVKRLKDEISEHVETKQALLLEQHKLINRITQLEQQLSIYNKSDNGDA